jgi:large subunit ribosomal protein L13
LSTTLPKEKDIQRAWYVVDATDRPAGRLAAKVAGLLRGKGKVLFTPHIDTGDFVVVVNAEKVKLSGSKETQKIYKNYSGYPSGLKERPAYFIRARNPTRIIEQAVRGMLPRTRQGRALFKRLKVYAGPAHPHTAQQPVSLSM